MTAALAVAHGQRLKLALCAFVLAHGQHHAVGIAGPRGSADAATVHGGVCPFLALLPCHALDALTGRSGDGNHGTGIGAEVVGAGVGTAALPHTGSGGAAHHRDGHTLVGERGGHICTGTGAGGSDAHGLNTALTAKVKFYVCSMAVAEHGQQRCHKR